MIKSGMHRLKLRKLSTVIASTAIFIGVPLFTIAPTPLLATLACESPVPFSVQPEAHQASNYCVYV